MAPSASGSKISLNQSADLTIAAVLAAQNAGQLLKKGFASSFQTTSKDRRQNLVTEYDIASQELIISLLRSRFPSHSFLAEEGEMQQLDGEVVWIIDPLDGTANFVHSIPIFAISIGALYQNELISSVIFNPMTDELFVAQKNFGAYLNGKRMCVSQTKQFDQSLMATGFPYNVDEDPLHCIERLSLMVKKGIPIRRMGAAAIDLAYVAAGRFDAYWEVSLQPWDMAAGKLLIEEAGGRVSHYDGSPHQIFGSLTMLATNGHLHSDMIKLLKEDLKSADRR